MPNGGFNQYGTQAGAIADSYGLNRSVFFGLIDAESSWNPNASPGTTSAYGLTQLTKGTASDLGVNRFDPTQNMQGGAQYLSSLLGKFGGDYTKALAAYHDGAGAIGQHGGFAYAKTVLAKAQGYLQQGSHLLGLDGSLVDSALNAVIPGSGTLLGAVTGADSCGIICQIEDWIKNSGFFERLALAVLGLIVLYAAMQLFRNNGQSSPTATVKKAAKLIAV